MLPGYTAPSQTTLRNHIHLGLWGGSGLLSYNEPPYRFGHITKRVPIYESAAQVVRGWSGAPAAHVLRVDGTNPTIFKHFSYTLRTDYLGLDLLQNLYKREIMFVEVVHCADTQDHAAYRWHYFFENLSYEDMLDPVGTLIMANITLLDMQTVSPLS